MKRGTLKNMIESILITEITRLYESAASPVGLTLEDVRKLEIFVKIKDLENAESNSDEESDLKDVPIEQLIAIAKSQNDGNK